MIKYLISRHALNAIMSQQVLEGSTEFCIFYLNCINIMPFPIAFFCLFLLSSKCSVKQESHREREQMEDT
jgi:hypothetical protein